MRTANSALLALALTLPPVMAIGDSAFAAPPRKTGKAEGLTGSRHTAGNPVVVWRGMGPAGNLLLADGTALLLTPPARNPKVGTVPAGRFDLDVSDVRLDYAVKLLFSKANERYEFDKNLPLSKLVSLKVLNVSFGTALEALLEQADLGFIQVKATGSTKNGINTLYRIGRFAMSNSTWLDSFPWPSSALVPRSEPGGGAPWIPWIQFDTGLPKVGSASDKAVGPGDTGGDTIRKIPLLGDLPIIGRLFTTRVREERSIFTCPRCHQQATVIRGNETPKCPDCGRLFEANWKVCPFDGSRRPTVAGEWRFCPSCGKAIN